MRCIVATPSMASCWSGRCAPCASSSQPVAAKLEKSSLTQKAASSGSTPSARGLHVLPEGYEFVAVHDSARALVSVEVIARAVAEAREHGAAIAAVPQADTLEAGHRGCSSPPPCRAPACGPRRRHRCSGVTGSRKRISNATEIATDDATLIEWLGHPVRLSLGEPLNFKITTAADLELAEAWLVHRVDVAARFEGRA